MTVRHDEAHVGTGSRYVAASLSAVSLDHLVGA